ncbi:MAG: hypothetical protein RML35_09820 [Chloroherpetonaceae bacterium]|nr:hypothetical protein [Chloroherpetonaceae bacterium]
MIRIGGHGCSRQALPKHLPRLRPNPPAFTFASWHRPWRFTRQPPSDVNAVGAGADPTTRTITVTPVAALRIRKRTSGEYD